MVSSHRVNVIDSCIGARSAGTHLGTRVVARTRRQPEKNYNARRSQDLMYAHFAELTWEWWCNWQGVEFVVLDKPLDDLRYQALPPTFQRWMALEKLFAKYGPGAKIALVDADTMVRWDTPDFFAIAGSQFAAVREWFAPWVFDSLRAYQHFFPGVNVPWWEYFNTGLTLLSHEHLSVTRAVTTFALEYQTELARVSSPWGFGDDQTLLNFIVRREQLPVFFLEPTYNVLQCVPVLPEIVRLEKLAKDPDESDREISLFTGPPSFTEMGYIWHFNNVVWARTIVMEQTWKQIRRHYSSL
jgi:hypothetical protein